MATRGLSFYFLAALFLFHAPAIAWGQINSWTSSGSGNWQDSYWSLGALPGTNQTILFTNEGVKSLTVGSNTVQNFPGTLNLNSITVSSPPGSLNALRLINSGSVTPLTVQSISIGSNATMTMYASALTLDGGNGVGMQVGGTFDQTKSIVSGQQVNVGYIGPGVYNLNSGLLDVSNLWVGGSGVFNQIGGTNDGGVVHLEAGGVYNFSGGDFNATVYFSPASTFHQIAGYMNQPFVISPGTYLQTGGTNAGAMFVGSGYSGMGNYVLSNGCSFVPGLNVGTFGTFHQFGGTQIITNGLYLAPDAIDYGFRAPNDGFAPGGVYWLSGGMMMAGGMMINYEYIQDGGTNLVTGDIVTANMEPVVFAGLELNGGLLTASNLSLTFGGALQLNGGKLVVNNLTAVGEIPATMALWGPDVQCLGGELDVSNIDVESDFFAISGTTVRQSGTFNLGGLGTLLPGSGTYLFGPLSGQGTVVLPTNANCEVHFGEGSSPSLAFLIIHNWSGSLYGGGSQRIFFGTNATALTSNQLSDILFEGLHGLPPAPYPGDSYPARILATGEIVPDTEAPLPPRMTVAGSTNNHGMQLSLGGDIGQSYDIEVSTDLVNWVRWTNELNSSGTIYLEDLQATNHAQRFYRARAVP